MSKKRLEREKLQEQLGLDIRKIAVFQKRPYTVVVVATVLKKGYFEWCYDGIGFTKVCWPDEWDEAVGIRRAEDKAKSDLLKKIQADMDAGVHTNSSDERWLYDAIVHGMLQHKALKGTLDVLTDSNPFSYD